jgi:serine acetyltransferase
MKNISKGLLGRNPDGTNTIQNPFIKMIWNFLHSYNHKVYWRRREIVTNPNIKASKLRKLYFLLMLKRNDIKHHSSFGINLNKGAYFKTPPILPHGPYGIIIGFDCIIGKNATIYHQVTIMDGNVIIGDNVLIGTGAKILPNVRIGNKVKVGANCVVVEDIPDNTTVVLQKPRIIYGK